MARFVVGPGEGGRLDRLLAARYPGVGRRRWAQLLAGGAVRIGGRVARKGDRVAPGDAIDLDREPAVGSDLAPVAQPELPLAILHQDDLVVAIDKPAGMPSHPLVAGETGTVANALVARFPGVAGAGRDPREAGLVHRLDRGTSGVLLAARTPEAWHALRGAFSGGRVSKRYLALVLGAARDGRCDLPLVQRGRRALIAHDHGARGAMAAETRWRVRATAPTGPGQVVTLVEAETATGRMHQVRAHLAAAGHPLVGDPLYGGPIDLAVAVAGGGGESVAVAVALPFLHAAAIEIDHPAGTGRLAIQAPLPPERAALLARLGLPP